MANKNVFGSHSIHSNIPATDTHNAAGGKAYSLTAEEALAQLAATGTFNKTFYGEGNDQLKAVFEMADKVSPLYLAQTAVYARQKAAMKDMPAALAVMLTKADSTLASLVFEHVIDNGKQLRNYVQMTTSGAFGRSHFSGSTPKRLVARWLNNRSAAALLRASVGNSPTLAQIIALAHPKPKDDERRALYGYFRGHEAAAEGQPLVEETEVVTKGESRTKLRVRYNPAHLPEAIKQLEAFKVGTSSTLPAVDFRFLAGMKLTKEQWAAIARNGRIMQTFKNLNTYTRHGVFEVPGMEAAITAKLRDKKEIADSRLFPYQLLAAYVNAAPEVPANVKDALQDTMEIATAKVEAYGVPVVVIVDVSGSMSSPITGHRKGATSKVRCVDVAGLIGAVIMRKNPGSIVIPVDDDVKNASDINPRDSVMTIATKLASYGGGGTALDQAIIHLNRQNIKAGLIVLISDMETWGDRSYNNGSGIVNNFATFKSHNPGAKLVTLNLQASMTTQAPSDRDVLNIGGFSDNVFATIGRFVRGAADTDAQSEQLSDWVREIQAIDVYALGKPSAGTDTAADDENSDQASEGGEAGVE